MTFGMRGWAMGAIGLALLCQAGDPGTAVRVRPLPAGQGTVPATVDSILAGYVEGRGGRPALTAMTNWVAKGVAEAAHLGTSVRCEVCAQAPRQRVFIFHVPNQGTVVDGFDGEHGWFDDPAFGRTEWVGEELAKRRRDAAFHRELEFAALYPGLKLKGVETSGGEAAWLLESRPSPQAEERFWIGQRSRLLTRHESVLHLPMGLSERSVEYGEYRPVAGVRFPHLWRVRQRGVRQAEPEITLTIRFEQVQVNVAIDPAQFRRAPSE